jgi:hypothetical protein
MESREINTVQEFGLIAKSKKELYSVLTTDGGMYLPPIKEANAKYIRKIVTGQGKVTSF